MRIEAVVQVSAIKLNRDRRSRAQDPLERGNRYRRLVQRRYEWHNGIRRRVLQKLGIEEQAVRLQRGVASRWIGIGNLLPAYRTQALVAGVLVCGLNGCRRALAFVHEDEWREEVDFLA